MKVLVTGGAGYIGSHTCVELLSAGEEIAVVDNFSNSGPEALRRIREITGRDFSFDCMDLRDRAALEEVFRREKPDAVIHFAGYKAVGESVRKPLEYYDNNLWSFITLAEVMKDSGVRRFIFSSSATVYGMSNPVPFREGYPVSATNPYGWTKVMIERMLTDLVAADPGWSVVMLRYFNPIGAHPSGLIGEDPNGIPNNLVPYVAKVASGELPCLNVFGGDYPTPDGTGVRDYIHVCDLAEGHVAALRYAREHTGAETVNLGTGKGTSVLEIVSAYEQACGHPIAYRITDRRPGDIAECYADTARAKELLGWTAKRDVAEMCRDSWNFTLRNGAKN